MIVFCDVACTRHSFSHWDTVENKTEKSQSLWILQFSEIKFIVIQICNNEFVKIKFYYKYFTICAHKYVYACVYTHTHHTTPAFIMYINLECLGIHNSNVIFFPNHFTPILVPHVKDLKMLRVCKLYYCCRYY